MGKYLKKLYKDQRGDLVDTSFGLVMIFGIFIAFFLYSSAARTKVVMNYSAKEGSRMYAISRSASEGEGVARDYLSTGGVKSASVSSFGESGLRITNDLSVKIPFFNNGENLALVSEYEFFKEFDPKYYEMGNMGDGWLKAPYTRSREYKDDSERR